MSVYHGDLFKRKSTGGKKNPYRSKRRYEMGRPPTLAKISEDDKTKKIRVRGGGVKIRVLQAAHANVAVEKDRVVRARILDVVENPASREFNRMKVITKGAVIRTEVGNAVVTSKPGADGVVNARLVSAG